MGSGLQVGIRWLAVEKGMILWVYPVTIGFNNKQLLLPVAHSDILLVNPIAQNLKRQTWFAMIDILQQVTDLVSFESISK